MNVRTSAATTVPLLLLGSGYLVPAGSALADDGKFLKPGTLVISSSVYENWKGAVATLTATGSNPTQLPNTDTATISAVSDGNYVTVWNNDTVDSSFGVTSPIFLTDVDAQSGRPLAHLRVPEEQVVTSFSSKSELALHYSGHGGRDALVFVAYAGAGVGALDVVQLRRGPRPGPH